MRLSARSCILVGSIAFLISAACQETSSDKVIPDQKVEVRDGIYYGVESEEPYNGTVKYYDRNGVVRMENEFENGRVTSTVSYDPQGNLTAKSIHEYEGDKRIATTNFYPDGSKKYEQNPEFVKEWFPNGQLKYEAFYDEEGELSGTVTLWDSTGAVVNQETYEHGELVEE